MQNQEFEPLRSGQALGVAASIAAQAHKGRPKSVAEADSQLSSIGEAFATIALHREQLERYVDSMERRLSPVLQGENRNGQDCEKRGPEPPMSPVKAQLIAEADLLRSVNERLSSILDRLEL